MLWWGNIFVRVSRHGFALVSLMEYHVKVRDFALDIAKPNAMPMNLSQTRFHPCWVLVHGSNVVDALWAMFKPSPPACSFACILWLPGSICHVRKFWGGGVRRRGRIVVIVVLLCIQSCPRCRYILLNTGIWLFDFAKSGQMLGATLLRCNKKREILLQFLTPVSRLSN